MNEFSRDSALINIHTCNIYVIGRVVSNFIIQALQGKDMTIYGEGKVQSMYDMMTIYI